MIKKVKNTILSADTFSDINEGNTVKTFYEKEMQKTNKKEFRIEKVIKRNRNRRYVKCKGYDNSFNSWINMTEKV